MPMKRDARMPASRRQLALAIPRAAGREARPISALPMLARGELVRLLQRLKGEVETLLDDLDRRREPSRNRESSRR
jgi:hypothetical protein